MSLVLIEGFEDLSLWGTAGNFALAGGRNGNALRLDSNGASSFTIPTALQTTTLTAGIAFKPVSNAGFNITILGFNSDANATAHISALMLSNGALQLVTGGSARYTTAAGVIALGNWYYVELQGTLHASAGTAAIRLNGTLLTSLTGIVTKNGGTKTVFDSIALSSAVSCVNTYDDLYVTNSIDTFWGDVAVETLYPDGMDSTAWTGSDGDAVNNYLLVDDPGTPVDTDYVQSSSVAARETYTCQNLVRTSGSVLGVDLHARANKSDSGARGLKVVAKEGGSLLRSTADNALTTTFADYSFPMEKKNDNSAWTIADVNALTIGVEVGS